MLAVVLSGEDLASVVDVNYSLSVRNIIQKERSQHLAADVGVISY